MFCFFFFKMEAEEDFFNTPFPPSVSKDNQMREMPRSRARARKMLLQDNFPIWVPEGWGGEWGGGKRLGREGAASQWAGPGVLVVEDDDFIKAGFKPEGTCGPMASLCCRTI